MARSLAILAQPSIIGGPGPVGVVSAEVRTALGAREVTANGPATIAIASGPAGAVLGGTLTRNAVDGLVVFDDLTVDLPGYYTFSVTADEIDLALYYPGLDPTGAYALWHLDTPGTFNTNQELGTRVVGASNLAVAHRSGSGLVYGTGPTAPTGRGSMLPPSGGCPCTPSSASHLSLFTDPAGASVDILYHSRASGSTSDTGFGLEYSGSAYLEFRVPNVGRTFEPFGFFGSALSYSHGGVSDYWHVVRFSIQGGNAYVYLDGAKIATLTSTLGAVYGDRYVLWGGRASIARSPFYIAEARVVPWVDDSDALVQAQRCGVAA